MTLEEQLIRDYITTLKNTHLNDVVYTIDRIDDEHIDYPNDVIVYYRHSFEKCTDKLYIRKLSLLAFVYDRLKNKN